jgi:hypothetical protein
MSPRGSTRVVGIIGDPVTHSRSPAIHNAAFAALGLDWVYVAFPVSRGLGAAAVGSVRTLGLAGLNVTMPHKSAAADACDDLSEAARALESVNTVVNRDGLLFGDSTDGAGLLGALADEGVDVTGHRCRGARARRRGCRASDRARPRHRRRTGDDRGTAARRRCPCGAPRAGHARRRLRRSRRRGPRRERDRQRDADRHGR